MHHHSMKGSRWKSVIAEDGSIRFGLDLMTVFRTFRAPARRPSFNRVDSDSQAFGHSKSTHYLGRGVPFSLDCSLCMRPFDVNARRRGLYMQMAH